MKAFHLFLLVGAAAMTAACSDSNGTGQSATVAFNVATRPDAPAALALAVTPDTLNDGTNVLVIDTAQLVIRDLKFHLVETAACNDDDESDDDNGGDNHGGQGADDVRVPLSSDDDDDDCDELRIGPYLLDLPLGPGPARQFTIEIPAGSYREVKFKIHKPSRSSDASFVAANPEFDGKSVRVVGSYNGTPFVYSSDVEASQESEFDPPLVVDAGAGTELTLMVDISTWFRVNGSLVDPALAGDSQPLGNEVRNNIRASIRAFEDDDHDGHDDDGHDDDHGGSGSGHDD